MENNNDTKCPEASSALVLYLYGETENPAAFESHLESCAECRKILEEHRSIIAAYRAESVEAPQTIELRPQVSLWDRILDLVSMPKWRPVIAGSAALLVLVALMFFNSTATEETERIEAPSIATSEVPSYMEISYEMDAIEEDIDNLFAMNGYSEFDTEEIYGYDASTQEEEESYGESTNLITELDEIQENIQKF